MAIALRTSKTFVTVGILVLGITFGFVGADDSVPQRPGEPPLIRRR